MLAVSTNVSFQSENLLNWIFKKILYHLQVIAGLYYNADMMLGLLETTHFPDSTESITSQLFKQWVKDAELFIG